jgi:hypothetical protein
MAAHMQTSDEGGPCQFTEYAHKSYAALTPMDEVLTLGSTISTGFAFSGA